MSDDTAQLTAYLARIGLDKRPATDAAGLAEIQFAHRRTITFENLDIMLGRAVDIGPDAVFDKLVTRRRGGYCFEQNTLYARMLTAIGFTNRLLLARVLLGDPADLPPLTHCLVLVELDGEPWVADAGFGGSYVAPMPLRDGAEATTPDGARHRLRRIGDAASLPGEWQLERLGPSGATDGRAGSEGWQKQYAFTLGEIAPADLELGNLWTSTHPTARFTNLHVVSQALENGFARLTEREFATYSGGKDEARMIDTPEDYHTVLRDVFGLGLSAEEAARLPLFA